MADTSRTGIAPPRRRGLVARARHVLCTQGQTPAGHHLMLLERLELVADGAIDRLMVLMPPGSAKSDRPPLSGLVGMLVDRVPLR